ncbi:TPA: hypothetical protein DDW35_05210 [Candidatus Sumerlaeota bacterium]|nr:hypothetical protein [Candidatus Sumerlaeota bacterium]
MQVILDNAFAQLLFYNTALQTMSEIAEVFLGWLDRTSGFNVLRKGLPFERQGNGWFGDDHGFFFRALFFFFLDLFLGQEFCLVVS